MFANSLTIPECGRRAETSGDGEIFPLPGPARAGTDTSSPGPVPFVAPPSRHTLTFTEEIISLWGRCPPDPQEEVKQ